ncbi:MAG: hypothetical protein LBL46_00700 [Rickettsiales bacterium]|jgi:hypothetical protein|nr:hypothetical protein [Rickettsiales bacterium]
MKHQTSNEQCAMSNCCARKRNIKFLLLIAHCALLIPAGAAQGAKLCAMNPAADYSAPQANSFTCNFSPSNPRFELGVGCGGTVASAWAEMPAKGACSQVLAGGSTKCETGKCYCRITYPYVSDWSYATDFQADRDSVCQWQCNCYCGLMFMKSGLKYGGMFY